MRRRQVVPSLVRPMLPWLLIGWATAACTDADDQQTPAGSETAGVSGAAPEAFDAHTGGNGSQGTGGNTHGVGGSTGGGQGTESAATGGEAGGGTTPPPEAGAPSGAGSSSTGGVAAGGEGGSGSVVPIDDVQPDDLVYEDLAASLEAFAELESTPLTVTPAVSKYELPVTRADVLNLDRDIVDNDAFTWSTEREAQLLEDGLVVFDGNRQQRRFDEAYQLLKQHDIPILVTTDSTLHLYHVFFDQLLKNVELTSIIPMHRAMLPALADVLASMVVALEGDSREAARRTLAYVSVAGVLLDPDHFAVYSNVSDEVSRVIDLVSTADKLEVEPILNRGCAKEMACGGDDLSPEDYAAGKACLCEDFTQYKPRGHYTEHVDLERYFRSTMYLGRIGLRIKSPMETRMAAILTAALARTTVSYDGQELAASDLWSRVYRVTSFFAGTSDDLTFVEYDRVLKEVYGDGYGLQTLESSATLDTLRARLEEERKPAILSGFVRAGLDKAAQTMGLRFYGQRFAFDSYVLGQLVFDHVGPNPLDPNYDTVLANLDPLCRIELEEQPITESFDSCEGQTLSDWNYICCSAAHLAAEQPELQSVCRFLPSGLDVAAAFGSARARDHLKPHLDGYCDYREQLDAVTSEAAGFTLDDWGKNLYTAWLYGLNPFFAADFSQFPTWMSGDAYRDKGLNTALASWAELRHDTILYVKQSYTAMAPGNVGPVPPPEAMYYVEPVPDVYARLGDLARMTERGLSDMGMFPSRVSGPNTQLIALLDELVAISVHELQGLGLTEDETATVDNIGATFQSILVSLGKAVTLETNQPEDVQGPSVVVTSIMGDPFKTAVVADVHTDGNLEQVLEVASGQVDWMVVVNRLEDGSLGATVGPVFSYYEFPWPMKDRLNDDQWSGLLSGSETPARPEFLDAIRAP